MSTIEQLAQLVTKEGYAPVMLHPEVRRLCELVRADAMVAEREACANLVFHSPPSDEYESPLMAVCNAIRNRSNT